MKRMLLVFALLQAVAFARDIFPRRCYYEQANEQHFDEVHIGMKAGEVEKICGGRVYPPFETIRIGFAFAVDGERSGILSLPWHIDLDQMVDFFTSKKRVLVVFYKNEKTDGIMIYDFAKGRWENRSRPRKAGGGNSVGKTGKAASVDSIRSRG